MAACHGKMADRDTSPAPPGDDPLRDIAARWVARIDRGLTPAEQAEFDAWKAADPRHAEAIGNARQMWRILDAIPAEFTAMPVAEKRARVIWPANWGWAAGGLAAAALVAAMVWRSESRPATTASRATAADTMVPRHESRSSAQVITLDDGSTVHLNAGAALQVRFGPAERRVELTRGEAHFTVQPDPARTFVVHAGALHVRAVGTAFNVSLTSRQVEVLVTEGRVQLAPAVENAESSARSDGTAPLLERGERAIVPASMAPETLSARLQISRLEPAEIARVLAWQNELVRLGGAPLAELAVQFEQRTGRRIVLADPELAQLRVGGRFRADDIDGFAALLASSYDITLDRQPDGTLVLRKKTSSSR